MLTVSLERRLGMVCQLWFANEGFEACQGHKELIMNVAGLLDLDGCDELAI